MRENGPQTQSPLVVGVLGRIRATTGGRELDLGGPRQRALLAVLAVERGRTVPTDTLIDAVWDGKPPDAAERTFRTYVSRLRKSLGTAGVDGADVVLTDAVGYRLAEDLVVVDADLFEHEVGAAREQLVAGEAALAAQGLTATLGRWEGRALGSFATQAWAAPTSVRLEEQRLVAQELLVRALLDAERVADAVTRAEELGTAEPLRETVARLHAQALYRSGRDADALRVTREFRERLAEEHGIDPSPRLGELESMILERDPRLDRSVGGRRLRGYVLHEPIAHSPLGTVHRAEQPSIGREVAITVLPPERADDPDVVRAFEARIQAVAGLDHAHLLPVYDYWREPGGAYVVTRFPSGGTLAQRLRTGPLTPHEALHVGAQVGEALLAAHEAGVAHGGLGPDAVVIDEHGDAFVWGFPLEDAHPAADVTGLAELVAVVAGGEIDLTADRAVLPEVAEVAVRRALDPADAGMATMAGFVAALGAAEHGAAAPQAPVQAPVGPNPYRGLAAFREADADVFFGRGELVEQLRARVARSRAVAVVGPSGSGKSSAVRAGLLPHLRADGAYVTTMVPGTHPLAELEVALSRVAAVELHGVADEVAATPAGLDRVVRRLLPGSGGELVLVVDQFEELFTIAEPTERDLLCKALRAAADDPSGAVRVVATVRADFLARVLAHHDAGPLVRDRSVMVTPLTGDELHEVVTGPAEVAGVAVEPALATAIVADAARFPASLPMVQFALTEVFEAAEEGTMELGAYRRIGGIEGVLGQRAEEVFAGLDGSDRKAAHQLFQRLVVPNADGPPTRRRALRTELAHVPEDVVEAFGRARLVRFDHDDRTREPTVEVTHEALFRAWPRLVAWIEEDADDLRLLGHLTVSAGEWDERGRTEADLYRGNRLDAALAFADGHRDELSPVERDFLDASRARRARDAEADRRSVRRLRILTAGLAVGLVLALVAGTVAVFAERQEAVTAAAAQADALAFAATATLSRDRELAALLAAEAYAASPDVGSHASLVSVLADDPRIRRVLPIEDGLCPTLGGDAGLVAYARPVDGGFVVEVRTTEMLPVAEIAVDFEPTCPVVDPSGSWVVLGDLLTSELHAIDLATGRRVATAGGWPFPSGPDVSFHPTEPELAFVTAEHTVRRLALPDLRVLDDVDVVAGREVVGGAVRYGEVGDRVVATFFRDEGPLVAVVDRDGEIVETAQSPGISQGPPALAEQAGIVVATTMSGVWVAPVEPGGGFEPVVTRGAPLTAAEISPDGTRMSVGTSDGIEIVDLASRRLDGDPIDVETYGGITQWAGSDALRMVTPQAVVTVDLRQSVPVGELLVEAPPAPVGTWPARDGSGSIVFADEWSYVHAATGRSVEVAEGSQQEPRAVLPLPRGRWAVLDPVAGTFEIRSLDGQEVLTRLPPELAGEGASAQNVLLFEAHGVAMVTIERRGAGQQSYLVGFDTEDGSLQARIPVSIAPATRPSSYEALPDGRFAVTYQTGTLEIVNADGNVEASVEARPGVAGVGVDLDGSRVARGWAEEIVVYDVALEQELVRLTGLPSSVGRFSFLADDLLLTRHRDGSTLLWDLEEAKLVGTIANLGEYFRYGYAVSPDGRAVVHATPTGIASIPVDAASWADAACALVGRPLTQDELDAVAPGRTLLDPCGFDGEV